MPRAGCHPRLVLPLVAALKIKLMPSPQVQNPLALWDMDMELSPACLGLWASEAPLFSRGQKCRCRPWAISEPCPGVSAVPAGCHCHTLPLGVTLCPFLMLRGLGEQPRAFSRPGLDRQLGLVQQQRLRHFCMESTHPRRACVQQELLQIMLVTSLLRPR